jgi:hypothetical protein
VVAEYKTFHEAFFALQGDLPEVEKSSAAEIPGRAPTHYANLKTVTDAALPVLQEYGFTWICLPTVANDKPVMHYELTHVASGDSMGGDYPIFGDNKPQSFGAAITYARRYALCAALGLTPDREGDAEGTPVQRKAPAKKTAPKKEPARPATEERPALPSELPAEPMMNSGQRGKMFALLGELGLTDAVTTRATINGLLEDAKLPAIVSRNDLTQKAASVVIDGLQKELDLRTSGVQEPPYVDEPPAE